MKPELDLLVGPITLVSAHPDSLSVLTSGYVTAQHLQEYYQVLVTLGLDDSFQ